MQLDRQNFDDTAVVRCTADRLDAASSVKFKGLFRGVADGADNTGTDTGPKRFVLEMSTVQFMDSSGLGAVVSVYKSLGEGVVLDLAGLTPPVERVFRLTKMDSIFKIFASVDDALVS
ncbi:MAG: STAS domain-containing protein [Alphaproteobacteria bacterium]|nr:STAS domain-containing protein [Alphaproteobacteria bacterium]